MQRVEFNTIIDKPYIEIPNYAELKGHRVGVVLLDLEDNTQQKLNAISIGTIKQSRKFTPKNIIKTKNFKFDREEANER
jgi:hypothetical protein